MKKTLIAALVLVLVIGSAFAFTACNAEELNFGKKLVKTEAQVNILTELVSGTADVGVMDSIMAGYYMSQDTNYAGKLMVVDGLVLADENYGIAAKKGNAATICKINMALVELKKNGTIATIAAKYGLANELAIDENATYNYDAIADTSDWDAIVTKDEFMVGYTLFAPIAYKDANDKLIGFDTELASAVANYYGLTAKFQEIQWETKEAELASGAIDFVWNGMTITEERQAAMEISAPYLKNKQVAVIRQADKDLYKTTADMSKAIIAVESGSAAQDCVVKAK